MNQLTKRLNQVECIQCRKAFAKQLQELPDVFPKRTLEDEHLGERYPMEGETV